MKFLDGFKTVLGALGTVALILFPKLNPTMIGEVSEHLYGIVQGAFALLTLFGVIHKIEKALGKGREVPQ
jgi:hypothetical protein